jgi:DNA polymerase IV
VNSLGKTPATMRQQPKFIHCDCDCFYAAIEMRDDPDLRGLPIAVGGEADSRGVIATCNYEARRYGVHSAMASSTARRLCRDLIIIPPSMEKYKVVSMQIMRIYQQYTDLVEPLSLDEAFLDVSHSTACKGSGTLIAQEIRQRIKEELGITVSAGIAPNKFLAKVASDWNKPDGQFAITPSQVADFVRRLSVKKIHGVGKVTAKKMELLGIDTCGDLQRYSMPQLLELFGSFGERLYELCRGEDKRQIATNSDPKSISVEETFVQDVQSLEQCLAMLPMLFKQLEQRLHAKSERLGKGQTIHKLFIKIKFNNFISTTVEQVAYAPDLAVYSSLCRTGFERNKLPVRLLGLGVRLRSTINFHQLELPFIPY